jgi:hypothetical protein
LEEIRPVLFIEVHDSRTLQEFGSSKEQVLDLLEAKNYRISKICGKAKTERYKAVPDA